MEAFGAATNAVGCERTSTRERRRDARTVRGVLDGLCWSHRFWRPVTFGSRRVGAVGRRRGYRFWRPVTAGEGLVHGPQRVVGKDHDELAVGLGRPELTRLRQSHTSQTDAAYLRRRRLRRSPAWPAV